MHLSEIWIYPVKSLGGIRLSEAKMEERGLQLDRRWMIIDENNKFVTQRTLPKMALIDVYVTSEGLKILNRTEPDNAFTVPFQPVTSHPRTVTIWDDVVEAVTVSNEADQWLSEQLGFPAQLVKMPENTERKADPKYAKNGEIVSFADGYPFLIISEASLQELNTKLESEITMRRFRPNFVISGTRPFEEDQWKNVNIGAATFEIVKPCARCVLTTIDPQTAEKGPEPLKTLATFRKFNNKIMFGQNAVAKILATLREGDIVTVGA
ncbi:MOSC domain-containing protein [Dyadobacter aurulentus]|uniref:MOSC domain-containing protein n=1 Tax=Dyadobacter sp. UC 10 TaxID=2605428 RepID=UPI0011F3C6B4|nr:MOSC N-terminal beta barrel domain-containing protein [Dyadobacter sp. UC 10]KAA0991387.1 MOSC domain-containing protein [Dyadobacter sp. UC 10]